MTCDKCGKVLQKGDSCYGVSRGAIEEDGFYTDYDPWTLFCEFCWDATTELIWPENPPVGSNDRG